MVIFEQRLKGGGEKPGVYLGDVHGRQVTANAKALSCEHVFCVGGASIASF